MKIADQLFEVSQNAQKEINASETIVFNKIIEQATGAAKSGDTSFSYYQSIPANVVNELKSEEFTVHRHESFRNEELYTISFLPQKQQTTAGKDIQVKCCWCGELTNTNNKTCDRCGQVRFR